MTITAERLRELLSYDPLTGVFLWRVDRRGHAGRAMRGSVAGGPDGGGRWRIGVDGRRYFAHQLAWLHTYGEWPAGQTDHRDLDKQNNRIANLRPATNQLNMANRPAPRHNTSGFKGASFDRSRGQWKAQITVDYRNRMIGRFSTPEAAHAAYVAAAREAFGEFARGF